MEPSELEKLGGVDLHLLRATDDKLVQTDAEDRFSQKTGADERSYSFTDASGTQHGTLHDLLFHTDSVRDRVMADLRDILTTP